MKFSIESGFSIRAPLWPQKNRPGIEIFKPECHCKLRMKFSSGNGSFGRGGGTVFPGPSGSPENGGCSRECPLGFRGSVPRGVPGTFGPRAPECPNSVLSPRPEGPQKTLQDTPSDTPHFRGTLPETLPGTLQAQRGRIPEDSCTRLGSSQKL